MIRNVFILMQKLKKSWLSILSNLFVNVTNWKATFAQNWSRICNSLKILSNTSQHIRRKSWRLNTSYMHLKFKRLIIKNFWRTKEILLLLILITKNYTKLNKKRMISYATIYILTLYSFTKKGIRLVKRTLLAFKNSKVG